MYKIGITDNNRKTTIANLFALFKYQFLMDKEIKKILNSKSKRKLKDRWPDIINGDIIDKYRLKSIIFSNKKKNIILKNYYI